MGQAAFSKGGRTTTRPSGHRRRLTVCRHPELESEPASQLSRPAILYSKAHTPTLDSILVAGRVDPMPSSSAETAEEEEDGEGRGGGGDGAALTGKGRCSGAGMQAFEGR